MHFRSLRRLAAPAAVATLVGLGLSSSSRAANLPPLNDPATHQQYSGKFIWADLFTNEPVAASTFYCSLLGWTSDFVEQKDKSFVILSAEGHPVAGIVLRSTAAAPHPGIWIPYISVAKARSAMTAASEAGGIERAPVHNFPHRGSEAIFTDAEGSVAGLLESSSGDRADEEPKPGEWNWFELYSLKPKAAGDFYSRVFGYEVRSDDRSGKSDHLLLSSGGHARGGIAPLPASPDSRPGWLGFVRVADLASAIAKVSTLGGTVLEEPKEAALGSRVAVISDPTGGAIGLVQYLDNANPAEKP